MYSSRAKTREAKLVLTGIWELFFFYFAYVVWLFTRNRFALIGTVPTRSATRLNASHDGTFFNLIYILYYYNRLL